MAIVTTKVQPRSLTASFEADGVTVNGLKVNYALEISHNGTALPEKVGQVVDVWDGIGAAGRAKVQDIYLIVLAHLGE